jgi:tetratricopeptide (TPR) repeat protein
MNMKTAGIIFIVLFVCSLPLHSDDRSIARAYFLKARDLAGRGQTETAQSLLREALDLLPVYSDNLFLMGQILCRRQATTYAGIPYLEQSIQKKTWSDATPEEASGALADAYLRTRRFREANNLYNRLAGNKESSSVRETCRALAAYGAGDRAGADAIFTAALKTYPEDKGIYLAYMRTLILRGLSAKASEMVERGLAEFPDEPRFMYGKISLTRDLKSRKTLLDVYLAKNGRNPAVTLFYLDADNDTFRRALDFFVNQKGDNSVLLLELLLSGLRNSKARREEAIRRIGMIDGEKLVDVDEDGFFEEQYTYSNNELKTALFDANQDGLPEAVIDFEKNMPVRLTLQSKPEEKLIYSYNGYPRLARLRIQRKDVATEYELIPDARRFAPLKNMPAPADFKLRIGLASPLGAPDEKAVRASSYTLTSDPADRTQPRQKWELFSGRSRVLHEDRDRDGLFERTVVFDDQGNALRGTVDVDNDGFNEIREIYVKGNLTRIEYDENKDGKPDYWQDAAGSQLEWDLNGDGRADVTGRRTPNGKIVPDYNGLFRRNK